MSRSGDVRAVDARDSHDGKRPEWRTKLISAVAATFALLHFADTATEDVAGILVNGSEIREQYVQLTSPTPAIEGPTTRSLPPGAVTAPDAQESGGVEDGADVVEGSQEESEEGSNGEG